MRTKLGIPHGGSAPPSRRTILKRALLLLPTAGTGVLLNCQPKRPERPAMKVVDHPTVFRHGERALTDVGALELRGWKMVVSEAVLAEIRRRALQDGTRYVLRFCAAVPEESVVISSLDPKKDPKPDVGVQLGDSHLFYVTPNWNDHRFRVEILEYPPAVSGSPARRRFDWSRLGDVVEDPEVQPSVMHVFHFELAGKTNDVPRGQSPTVFAEGPLSPYHLEGVAEVARLVRPFGPVKPVHIYGEGLYDPFWGGYMTAFSEVGRIGLHFGLFVDAPFPEQPEQITLHEMLHSALEKALLTAEGRSIREAFRAARRVPSREGRDPEDHPVFTLFREATYFPEGIVAVQSGHPWGGASEYVSSAAVVFRYYPRAFVAKLDGLDPGHKKVVASGATAVLQLLESRGGRPALKALIPDLEIIERAAALWG